MLKDTRTKSTHMNKKLKQEERHFPSISIEKYSSSQWKIWILLNFTVNRIFKINSSVLTKYISNRVGYWYNNTFDGQMCLF